MKTEILITILIPAILASQGFWSVLLYKMQKRDMNHDIRLKADLVILHDLVYKYCKKAIVRGYTTFDEFDNLTELFSVYKELGGNGTGRHLYDEVSKLPKHPLEAEET